MKEIHEGELLGYIEAGIQLWHCSICDTYWSQMTKFLRRRPLIKRESYLPEKSHMEKG